MPDPFDDFSVLILAKNFEPVKEELPFKIGVSGYAWNSIGGPDWARLVAKEDVNVFALAQLTQFIGHPIEIYNNATGDKVWWGQLTSVKIPLGDNYSVGVSLDKLTNKVKVVYSYTTPGETQATIVKETAWASDTGSINEFGTKERIIPMSDASDTQAENRRDVVLSKGKDVNPLVEFAGISEPEIQASGWWQTLDWLYYSHDAGIEANADEDATQDLGSAAGNEKIAQSFQLSSSTPWNIFNCSLKMNYVGAPTDDVYVNIKSDSGGLPGSVVTTAVLTYVDFPDTADWVTFNFATNPLLSLGTTYWIEIDRIDPVSGTNYYQVAVDEGLNYTSGVLKLWNGSSWVDRGTDADLSFKLGGVEETSVQIERILTNLGQFFEGVETVDASGIYSSQFRDGGRSGLFEVMELINAGIDPDKKYLVDVQESRFVAVYEEPEQNEYKTWSVTDDGILLDDLQTPVDPKLCTVGRWVQLAGNSPIIDQLSLTADATFAFIESAEYNSNTGGWRPKMRDTRDPIDDMMSFVETW